MPMTTSCPFHTYTASACGLASFPRKRESRRSAPWGLDARLRGHDVLLAPDLRNRPLAPRLVGGVGECTINLRAITLTMREIVSLAGGGRLSLSTHDKEMAVPGRVVCLLLCA